MATGQISVIFLLILAGIFIKKIGIITESIYSELGNLVIMVCMPAYILSAMNFSFSVEILKNSGFLVLLSFVVYFVCIILGEIFIKILGKKGAERDVYQYACVFSNSGYMGYPVIEMIFGTKALFYAAVYNMSFSLLMWSYGVYVLTRSNYNKDDRTAKDVLLNGLKSAINPSMMAVIIGFILFFTGIKLPTAINTTISIIGRATTPLAMMFIGFILSDVKIKNLFEDVRDFIVAAYRLLILPFILYLILNLFGITGMRMIVPVMIAAMPASANSALIALKYKSDARLASKLVFISTLLSVITIPIIANLLK